MKNDLCSCVHACVSGGLYRWFGETGGRGCALSQLLKETSTALQMSLFSKCPSCSSDVSSRLCLLSVPYPLLSPQTPPWASFYPQRPINGFCQAVGHPLRMSPFRPSSAQRSHTIRALKLLVQPPAWRREGETETGIKGTRWETRTSGSVSALLSLVSTVERFAYLA